MEVRDRLELMEVRDRLEFHVLCAVDEDVHAMYSDGTDHKYTEETQLDTDTQTQRHTHTCRHTDRHVQLIASTLLAKQT